MSVPSTSNLPTDGRAPITARPRRYLSPEQWLRENPDTIGRTLLYSSIRLGRIPAVKVGRRYLVPDDFLDQLLAA
jgi:excisionase family DNA binding protein